MNGALDPAFTPADIAQFAQLTGSSAEEQLRALAPDCDITFTRVAVTEDQIEQWDLPTRPTEKGDSRSQQFKGLASVELDAMPPTELRDLVEICITRHLDAEALERTQPIEREEREALLAVAEQCGAR